MTVGDLSAGLRRFVLLCLAVFLVVVAVGVAAVVLPANRYRTIAVLSVVPASKGTFDFGGTQIVAYLLPPVVTRLQSPLFATGIRELLPPDLRRAPVSVTAQNDPGTGIINLSITSSTRRAASDAANAALQRVQEFPRSDLIRITVLSPPTAPTSVKAERAPAILGGSIVLGFILAILSGVAAGRLRPALPTGERFREQYETPVLGEIPRVRRMPSTVAGVFDPSGPQDVAAAFRNLEARVSILLTRSHGSSLPLTLGVTSWGAGDGKSTVASNLAWALATLRYKVTLVDFDLRKPRVHALVEVDLSGGVSEVVAGADLQSSCKATTLRGLRVLTAGELKAHPAETVHDALPMLNELADPIVVFDTPPMFTPETVEIMGTVDAVLLVVDARTRKPRDVEAALAELSRANTQLLGVVMNRVRTSDDRGQADYGYD